MYATENHVSALLFVVYVFSNQAHSIMGWACVRRELEGLGLGLNLHLHAGMTHCMQHQALVSNNAIASALATHIDNELAGGGVMVLVQVFSTSLEVIKNVLLVAVGAGIMPLQPILSSSPTPSRVQQ